VISLTDDFSANNKRTPLIPLPLTLHISKFSWDQESDERFVGGEQLIDSTLLVSGLNHYQLKMKHRNITSVQREEEGMNLLNCKS